MLVYMLLGVSALLLSIAALFIYYAFKDNEIDMIGVAIMFTFLSAVTQVPTAISYSSHASDLAVIQTQQLFIEDQEDLAQSLNDRLENFEYPEKSMISVDHDSPWAKIVDSLTKTEVAITQSKQRLNVAKRSIRSRELGLFKVVPTWFDKVE